MREVRHSVGSSTEMTGWAYRLVVEGGVRRSESPTERRLPQELRARGAVVLEQGRRRICNRLCRRKKSTSRRLPIGASGPAALTQGGRTSLRARGFAGALAGRACKRAALGPTLRPSVAEPPGAARFQLASAAHARGVVGPPPERGPVALVVAARARVPERLGVVILVLHLRQGTASCQFVAGAGGTSRVSAHRVRVGGPPLQRNEVGLAEGDGALCLHGGQQLEGLGMLAPQLLAHGEAIDQLVGAALARALRDAVCVVARGVPEARWWVAERDQTSSGRSGAGAVRARPRG